MKTRYALIVMTLCLSTFMILSSCGEQADQSRPQPAVKAPMPQKAPQPKPKVVEEEKPAPPPEPVENAQTDLLKIKEAAMEEKNILMAKKDELQKLITEKAGIPLTEQMGAEAKTLSQKIVDLKNEIQEHTDRYNGYIDQLKAGDVDTSELLM